MEKKSRPSAFTHRLELPAAAFMVHDLSGSLHHEAPRLHGDHHTTPPPPPPLSPLRDPITVTPTGFFYLHNHYLFSPPLYTATITAKSTPLLHFQHALPSLFPSPRSVPRPRRHRLRVTVVLLLSLSVPWWRCARVCVRCLVLFFPGRV